MNINGINITEQDLLDNVDRMIYDTNVLICEALIDEYKYSGNVDGLWEGHVHKIQEELDDLMEYFIGTEEYERCGELKKIRDSYDGVPQTSHKQ